MEMCEVSKQSKMLSSELRPIKILNVELTKTITHSHNYVLMTTTVMLGKTSRQSFFF